MNCGAASMTGLPLQCTTRVSDGFAARATGPKHLSALFKYLVPSLMGVSEHRDCVYMLKTSALVKAHRQVIYTELCVGVCVGIADQYFNIARYFFCKFISKVHFQYFSPQEISMQFFSQDISEIHSY